MTISINRGSYRETDRHGVVRVGREPMGPVKKTGPSPSSPGWVFGHIPGQGMFIPAVGRERRSMGLSPSTGLALTVSQPRKGWKPTTVGGPVKKTGTGGTRGGGRKRRKAAKLAEVYAAQDAAVAAIKRRQALEEARRIAAIVAANRKIQAGDVGSLFTNPAFDRECWTMAVS